MSTDAGADRFGPCFELPPALSVWHAEHLVLKIFAPFSDIVRLLESCGFALAAAARDEV